MRDLAEAVQVQFKEHIVSKEDKYDMEGKNKPYHDNKGVIWVKNGADKSKVFDNSELAEMMSDVGTLTLMQQANRMHLSSHHIANLNRRVSEYKESLMKDYSILSPP